MATNYKLLNYTAETSVFFATQINYKSLAVSIASLLVSEKCKFGVTQFSVPLTRLFTENVDQLIKHVIFDAQAWPDLDLAPASAADPTR